MTERVQRKAGPGRGLGIRWHLALTYLVIIWVTLGVLLVFISRSLTESGLYSRTTYLYAQAHLLSSSIKARGGPLGTTFGSAGGVPAGARVLLIDGTGRVLSDSAMDNDMLEKNLTGVPEVRQALDGRQVANTYYLPDGSYVLYLAVPSDWDGRGGALFVSQNLDDIVAQHKQFMRAVLWGGCLASAAALAIAGVLSGIVSGPMLELASVAGRMSSGRFDLRVRPRGPHETRTLARSFNAMASSIESTFAAQEEFLMAAAHELRSPLAAMNILLESMEISPPSQAEFSELIEDLQGELKRLISTSEGILDLLRIRNVISDGSNRGGRRQGSSGQGGSRQGGAQVGCQPREFQSMVDQVVQESCLSAAEKGVVIKVDVCPVLCHLDPVIFKLVAGNLLDNAVKFSPRGGTVWVSACTEGSDLILSIQDQGPGIPSEDIPRVFDRFYRVDAARQKSTGGTGLGLAIVKEACQRQNAHVSLESRPGEGSVFTVRWHDTVA